jgi:hypothetical protein
MESTMGRPPIGKVAMTSAERTRRWVLKEHAAEVERLQARIRELEAGSPRERQQNRIAEFEARIRDLEAELSRERAKKAPSGIPRRAVAFAPERADDAPPPMPPPGTDWAALEQAVKEERKAQRAAAKAARAAAAVSSNMEATTSTMEALQAAKQQAQAELDETRKHLSIARKQLRQARTEIRRADRALNARSKLIMPREDYNKIINCLHPDRYGDAADRRRHEQALQIFTALKNAKQIEIR